MNSIVRFLKNKNTVTVIGIILIVAILWAGYYFQLQSQVKPVSVPVAATTIQPRTQITSDMIKYVDVPNGYISNNAIRSEDQIISMYSQYNTMIPEGSMFYTEAVTTEETMPNHLLKLLNEGEIGISLSIGEEQKMKGFNIMPNEKIDIYMKVTSDDGNTMFGKLLENMKVLEVLDESGNSTYAVNDGSRSADYLVFGVQEDLFLLLKRAEYLGKVTFIPVQHGAWVDDIEAKLKLTTPELFDYIKANTTQLSSDPTTSSFQKIQ